MVKYIIKRILLAIVILFGVSVIIYSLVRMMPGDFITNKFMQMVIDGKMSEKEFNRLLEVYGLADRSFWGILKGYFTWIGNVFQGDLGRSFKYEDSVSTIIVENMGISFGIAFAALILEFIIAIPLGVKAATNQYGVVDYSASVLSMIGTALPTFFFAAICIQLFSVQLGWFPVNGLTSTLPSDATEWTRFWDKIWHLVIPVFIMVFLSVGSLMRYTRTNTLEVLNADYIRTARAKGLREKTVIYIHAFRNALIPIVTITTWWIIGLFGGSIVIESVFLIPGLGKMLIDALMQRDFAVVLTMQMFYVILSLAGNVLMDIAYTLVDPRVRLEN